MKNTHRLSRCACRSLFFFFFFSFIEGKAFFYIQHLFKKMIQLFSIGCAGSLLLHRLFSSGEQGLLSSCGAQASGCCGFSCFRARVLECLGFSSCWASVVAIPQALEHRLSSCDAWAQVLCGMWDLCRPEIEPVSPALAGEFFTTEQPGKTTSSLYSLLQHY